MKFYINTNRFGGTAYNMRVTINNALADMNEKNIDAINIIQENKEYIDIYTAKMKEFIKKYLEHITPQVQFYKDNTQLIHKEIPEITEEDYNKYMHNVSVTELDEATFNNPIKIYQLFHSKLQSQFTEPPIKKVIKVLQEVPAAGEAVGEAAAGAGKESFVETLQNLELSLGSEPKSQPFKEISQKEKIQQFFDKIIKKDNTLGDKITPYINDNYTDIYNKLHELYGEFEINEENINKVFELIKSEKESLYPVEPLPEIENKAEEEKRRTAEVAEEEEKKNPELINTEDINSIHGGVQNLTKLPPTILDKLTNAQKTLSNLPYKIEEKYDKIYLTSDIHADLRKFAQLLVNAGIIKYENGGMTNILTIPEIPSKLLTDMKWIPQKTLIVIIGDLIDGARVINDNGEEHSVLDKKGNIELLLHVFLYNLRIKARKAESEVRFTVGNHDNETLSETSGNGQVGFMHPTVFNFFGGMTAEGLNNRKNCLMPFYKCSPYFILTINNEIVCVHGGIHRNDGHDITNTEITDINNKDIYLIQEEIETNLNKFETYQDDGLFKDKGIIGQDGNGTGDGPLWSRFYAENENIENTCNLIAEDSEKFKYKLIVVGHCPTIDIYRGNFFHHNEIKEEYLKTQKDNKCEDGGCVLIGCDTYNGPQLAFVDIGMSKAFHEKYLETSEFLLLEAINPAGYNSNTDRYYNKISRINVGSDIKTIEMWVDDKEKRKELDVFFAEYKKLLGTIISKGSEFSKKIAEIELETCDKYNIDDAYNRYILIDTNTLMLPQGFQRYVTDDTPEKYVKIFKKLLDETKRGGKQRKTKKNKTKKNQRKSLI